MLTHAISSISNVLSFEIFSMNNRMKARPIKDLHFTRNIRKFFNLHSLAILKVFSNLTRRVNRSHMITCIRTFGVV